MCMTPMSDLNRFSKSETAAYTAQLETAFEFAPIGKALVRLDGQFQRVNRALCAILGHSRDDLLTKSFQSITHPDDFENDLQNLGKLLAGEMAVYRTEKRYLHKDGHVV